MVPTPLSDPGVEPAPLSAPRHEYGGDSLLFPRTPGGWVPLKKGPGWPGAPSPHPIRDSSIQVPPTHTPKGTQGSGCPTPTHPKGVPGVRAHLRTCCASVAPRGAALPAPAAALGSAGGKGADTQRQRDTGTPGGHPRTQAPRRPGRAGWLGHPRNPFAPHPGALKTGRGGTQGTEGTQGTAGSTQE